MGIELKNMDCLDLLKSLPDASVDLMLTDPPYGITQNDWDKPINLAEMWLEWERVVKPNGAFVFTAQQPFTSDLVVSRRGFFKYTMVWSKTRAGGFLNAHKRPLTNHEDVVIFYRQQPIFNPQKLKGHYYRKENKSTKQSKNYGVFRKPNIQESDERFPTSIIEISNFNGMAFGKKLTTQFHPTEKPVDLMRYFVRTFTNPGETVFDGYSGSGTTAEACIIEGRNFIGSELNKEYYDKSMERISIALSKPELFT